MNKQIISVYTIVALVFSASPAFAIPSLTAAHLATPGTDRQLFLPGASENSPVISLGSAIDPQTGNVVEGIAIVHYRRNFTHKPNHNSGGRDTTSSCFSYLANGAKWKIVEPWVMNSANNAGLDGGFVFGNVAADIAKWEDAADGTVDGVKGADILGDGSLTLDALVADQVAPDGLNEVYFADVADSGAIAVTIVWGRFYGNPSQRELVEWDQVYDDADFAWSLTGEADAMDFENIATHEIGHAAGMGHPSDSCVDETMYRFATNGETKKRDLNSGDIAGINKLY